MTKIITQENKEIDIKYYQIENFCRNEIIKNNYIEDFNKFKINYNYFNAYFDYIFHIKKYILKEPLCIPNTYLYNKYKFYYILNNNEELVNSYNFDFSLMNDICASIVNNPFEINEGFFILKDGTLLTNNYVERHLKSAKMILNSYLINSITFYKDYLKFIENNDIYFQYKIIDFLTENLGIIHGKRYGKYIDLIINNEKITKEQLDTLKKIKKYFKTNSEDFNNYNKINKLIYRNR